MSVQEKLFDAVKANDLSGLQTIIESGIDVNSVDEEYKETPLHLAAKNSAVDIVKILIESGAAINAEDEFGRSPLHQAVSNGSLEVTQLLLEKGARINHKNNDGSTPLHGAAVRGHIKVTEYLLDNDADLEAQSNYGDTPIFSAIYSENLEIVECLINRGADIHIITKNRNTPLSEALVEENYEAAEMLMSKGAGFEDEAFFKWPGSEVLRSLIVSACENEELLKYIIKMGIEIPNASEEILTNDDPNIVKILKETAASKTAALLAKNKKKKFVSQWKDLEGSKKYVPAFINHFECLAETEECKELLEDLAKKVTTVEISSVNNDLALAIHFKNNIAWFCSPPINTKYDIFYLPYSFQKILKAHNGIEHINPQYDWDTIRINNVHENSTEESFYPKTLDISDEINLLIDVRTDRYTFHPKVKTDAKEPALGYINHEEDHISQVISKKFGLGGHFLRITGQELLKGDKRCKGF